MQKKHHPIISPVLRRIYFEDGEDRSRAVIDDLKLEIATPENTWRYPRTRKEIHQRPCRQHAGLLRALLRRDMRRDSPSTWQTRRRDSNRKGRNKAHVALDRAKGEMGLADQRLEELGVEYDALKSGELQEVIGR